MSSHHSGHMPLPGTMMTPFTTHICVTGPNGSNINNWFIVIHDFVSFYWSVGAILCTNCLHPMNWCTGMCSFSESLFMVFPWSWDSKSIRFKTYHHVISSVACPARLKVDFSVLSKDLCNAWAPFYNLHPDITKQYFVCNYLLELGWKMFILSVYVTTSTPEIYIFLIYIFVVFILMNICLVAKYTWSWHESSTRYFSVKRHVTEAWFRWRGDNIDTKQDLQRYGQ